MVANNAHIKSEVKSEVKSAVKLHSHNPLLTGVYVKHAVSGEKTIYKTGTFSELKMFRVTNCAGTETIKTYYSYPEEYERVNNVILSKKLKDAWMRRTESE